MIKEEIKKIVVLGGGGHVGLPLSVMLAAKNFSVTILDTSPKVVDVINSGKMPFLEPGAEPLLKVARKENTLVATGDAACITNAEIVIVVIGTPVDEHLNPDPNLLPLTIQEILPFMKDGQLLVLRSTVYPGVTSMVEELILSFGLNVDVAFCPERIAEHNAIVELQTLPQIVSSSSESGYERAKDLFSKLTPSIVQLSPSEAELAKLFTNTWRYIKFATANQFYMMANNRNLDYEKIRYAVRFDYPRAQDLPSAGFAAGPCLFKDTMQLAAFSDNSFQLGHSAMLINEGLPLYIISQLEKKYPLKELTVGILGMSFKAESDDIRSSLSYKLKRALKFRAKNVICTDEYVGSDIDSSLVTLENVLQNADVLIVGAPHAAYSRLTTTKPVADVWGILNRGVII